MKGDERGGRKNKTRKGRRGQESSKKNEEKSG